MPTRQELVFGVAEALEERELVDPGLALETEILIKSNQLREAQLKLKVIVDSLVAKKVIDEVEEREYRRDIGLAA